MNSLSSLVFLILVGGLAYTQYSWQQAFPNLPTFSNPVELVHANDGTGRFFVVQQRGVIYVFENTPDVSTRREFLNIADSVSQSGGETGLLGLAFHPDYRTNGYFYINHTNTVGGQLRSYIVRYQVSSSNPDSALRSSRFVLFTVNQPFSNHNGGKIAFGPDGYLFMGLGDGGSANDPGNRAQNRSELLGKILRINVDSVAAGLNYAIPTTNPFYGNTQGFREEIYAYGIRNPWKFSFDPVTHALWLGDVGQDAREEVDIVINGYTVVARTIDTMKSRTPQVRKAAQNNFPQLLTLTLPGIRHPIDICLPCQSDGIWIADDWAGKLVKITTVENYTVGGHTYPLSWMVCNASLESSGALVSRLL